MVHFAGSIPDLGKRRSSVRLSPILFVPQLLDPDIECAPCKLCLWHLLEREAMSHPASCSSFSVFGVCQRMMVLTSLAPLNLLAGRLDVVSVAARCGSKEPSRQDAQQRSVDPPKWRPLQVSARLLSSHAASCTKGASSLVHLA
eukprot:s3745_g11.t2